MTRGSTSTEPQVPYGGCGGEPSRCSQDALDDIVMENIPLVRLILADTQIAL